MTRNKRKHKEEAACIGTCLAALGKLSAAYWTRNSGDSVAEEESKRAIRRVLSYINDFCTDLDPW